MTIKHLVFGWIDYTLFSTLIGISLLIGVCLGFFSKQDSALEYLFGGKRMNYIPVAISLLASFISGTSFLGTPTEVYLNGSQGFASFISVCLTGMICIYIIVPTLYRLQVSSIFDYLEMRYSKSIRIFAAVNYIISLFLYMPLVMYVPTLAFSQVTGYNARAMTPIFCIICIIYTSMGGIKAVVWTDAFQFIFTVSGFMAILAFGVITVGGVSEAWRISEEGHRIKFFDMDPSLLKRDTFWAYSIGLMFSILSRVGFGQKFVQRYLAIPNESDVKKAIFMFTMSLGVFLVLCVFIGLLMYAQYHECDPLEAKLIKRIDEIVPYYVMDIAGHVPGLPGIFLAGIVSSALSTMSACLNTVPALIYETCFDQWISESSKKDVISTNIMKGISVLAGGIAIGLIFLVERLGTIFEMTVSLSSAMDGALLGLYLSGMLLPWIGNIGAMTGGCSSVIIVGFMVGGQQWFVMNKKIQYPNLPFSTEACPYPFNKTLSQRNTSSVTIPLIPEEEPMVLFRVATLYFVLIGTFIVIIIGGVTSFIVGETDLSKVNPECIAPIIRRVLRNKWYSQVLTKETDVQLDNVHKVEEKYCRKRNTTIEN